MLRHLLSKDRAGPEGYVPRCWRDISAASDHTAAALWTSCQSVISHPIAQKAIHFSASPPTSFHSQSRERLGLTVVSSSRLGSIGWQDLGGGAGRGVERDPYRRSEAACSSMWGSIVALLPHNCFWSVLSYQRALDIGYTKHTGRRWRPPILDVARTSAYCGRTPALRWVLHFPQELTSAL